MKRILTLLGLSIAMGAAQAEIIIKDAYVNAPPPMTQVTAGFFELENHGHDTVRLTHFSSPVAGKVELHATVEQDGMSKMIAQDGVDIPSHGSVKLQHGGLHLMLMKLTQELKPGDKVDISLGFDNGDELVQRFEVRDMRKHNMDHGHHGGHAPKEDTGHHGHH